MFIMGIDWSKIQKEYKGRWVALKDDERTVLASGKTAGEAWEHAQEAGYEQPILARVPDKVLTYVG